MVIIEIKWIPRLKKVKRKKKRSSQSGRFENNDFSCQTLHDVIATVRPLPDV